MAPRLTVLTPLVLAAAGLVACGDQPSATRTAEPVSVPSETSPTATGVDEDALATHDAETALGVPATTAESEEALTVQPGLPSGSGADRTPPTAPTTSSPRATSPQTDITTANPDPPSPTSSAVGAPVAASPAGTPSVTPPTDASGGTATPMAAGANTDAGRQVFLAQKCETCHSVSTAGIKGKMASGGDLAGVVGRIGRDGARAVIQQERDAGGKKHPKKFTGSEADLNALLDFLAAQ